MTEEEREAAAQLVATHTSWSLSDASRAVLALDATGVSAYNAVKMCRQAAATGVTSETLCGWADGFLREQAEIGETTEVDG